MKNKNESVELKTFNLRMPKETWVFLKNYSTSKEISMSEIVLNQVDKYKKRIESKLTYKDINV